MNTSSSRKNHALAEDGFAAIIVAMIIMAILVLVTVGFVRIVGREQRAAIDRQLSTQAFYAAETGVNDAANLLVSGALGIKDNCAVDDDVWSPQLEPGIEYTCVLVDPQPPSLEFDGVGQQSPRVITLKGVNASGTAVPIESINISWQSDPYPDAPVLTGDSDFPEQLALPVAAPVLRVTLTPLHQLSRQQLIENTMTFFLRPTSQGGFTSSVDYSSDITDADAVPSDQGPVYPVTCDTDDTANPNPKLCNFTINRLGIDAVGTSGYLLTIRSVYSNASVFIDGVSSSGTDELRFAEQQAIVDATGRASDVLRRIQVRVPLKETFEYPGFALEAAAGICKPYAIQGSNSGVNTGGNPDCDIL